MRIMIVEDNENMRILLGSLLEGIAEEITCASDGTHAVEAYGSRRPDVVLMDIEMPDMDGIEATSRIRAMDGRARVLMVTNYDEPLLRDSSRKAGAEGYFLKSSLVDLLDYLTTMRNNPNLN